MGKSPSRISLCEIHLGILGKKIRFLDIPEGA